MGQIKQSSISHASRIFGGSTVAIAACCLSLQAAAQSPAAPITLWQGLQMDMTPETALAVISSMEGVKRAKVIPERKSNPGRRLDIDHVSSGIQIAGLPFELAPQFPYGKLKQVWLGSSAQCGQIAQAKFNALAKALSEKYGPSGTGPSRLSEADIAGARLKSLSTNQKIGFAASFKAKDVVAVLVMKYWMEQVPMPPRTYSKIGHSLWKLSMTQYETRKAQCNGTGSERMDIRIGYMVATEFEAMQKDAAEERQNQAYQTREKL